MGFLPDLFFHLPSLFFSFSPQISGNSIMDEQFGIRSPQNPQRRTRYLKFFLGRTPATVAFHFYFTWV